MSEKPIGQMDQGEVNRELQLLLAEAGNDERRVLLFLCRRFINLGQRCIGVLNLATEQRDGFQETAEEAADGLFYMSLRFLVAQLHQPPKPSTETTRRRSRPKGRLWYNSDVFSPDGTFCCPNCGSDFFGRVHNTVTCHGDSGCNWQQNVWPDSKRVQFERMAGNEAGIEDWPERDTEPGRPSGPARYRNEAGQLVEDDDVPDEDWP